MQIKKQSLSDYDQNTIFNDFSEKIENHSEFSIFSF